MLLPSMKFVVITTVLAVLCAGQLLFHKRFRLSARSARKLKDRLQERIAEYRLRNTKTICYDIVGCFELPHKRSPLQKIPENPEVLDTKFYLMKRNFSQPEILVYDDSGKSLERSRINYSQPLKLIIHGYLGSWKDVAFVGAAQTYLIIEDVNSVVMDWSKGARGPHYATAAANTEVVGRQLGLLLAEMVKRGLKPKNIHLLGFSLGAHVAACASEVLKKKGHLISRITGLDVASPLFRTDHFREKYKKLDRDDAQFVDVIHTDSSPVVTDGFGLWEPIGDVDFFPNGGQKQPGCNDPRQSIVVSHFERGGLTKNLACSHIRAWQLFQETLHMQTQNKSNQCEFVAFTCPGGLQSFERGLCFPRLDYKREKWPPDPGRRTEIGRFGEDVRGDGVMYFATRATSPYCGTQLQASVHFSPKTGPVDGIVKIELKYSNNSVHFNIVCQVMDYMMTGTIMSSLTVAPHRSLDNVQKINATLQFINLDYDEINNTVIQPLYINKIDIRDMYDNRWKFWQENMIIGSDSVNVVLSKHDYKNNFNSNKIKLRYVCIFCLQKVIENFTNTSIYHDRYQI